MEKRALDVLRFCTKDINKVVSYHTMDRISRWCSVNYPINLMVIFPSGLVSAYKIPKKLKLVRIINTKPKK